MHELLSYIYHVYDLTAGVYFIFLTMNLVLASSGMQAHTWEYYVGMHSGARCRYGDRYGAGVFRQVLVQLQAQLKVGRGRKQ